MASDTLPDSSPPDHQKHRDVLAAFWPRKLSVHLTSFLLKTPLTPNQVTVIWGAISAMNSYLVYRVLLGDYLLLPVVPLVYVFTYVLDCVDGEIARARQLSNPVGGKLLDGVCHRATEYSLLAAYVLAADHLTASPFVLPVGLFLLAGEAMHTYAYERRLSTLRVNMGYTGLLKATSDNMYHRGESWQSLSLKKKIGTVKGQLQYKSIYAAVAVCNLSAIAFLAGLALLAAYKHVTWIRLIARTLASTSTSAKPVDTEKIQPSRSTAEAL
jgi:phosphatidylglycerophosphate synthase